MSGRILFRAIVPVLLGLIGFFAANTVIAAEGKPSAAVDFATEVLPILSDRCNLCHGPDETSRQAELRLDVAEVVGQPTANGGLDQVIAPGDASASELIRRITSTDASELMPPPDSKLTLTAEEIEVLRRWIDQGAKWGMHWSFSPIERPELPVVPRQRASTPIDRLVVARLDEQGLEPTALADRHSLIRRMTLDLTGLPPTEDEIAEFVHDEDPTAYAKLVDRLLATPEHGQQMAVPWLDAARYADTYGYQSDVYREVWPWRDWVVDAFQQGMPYDQFLRWQIAGDLIPNATRESRLATAFNRLHRQTNEGGSVEEEFRTEYIADRVHTLGTAVLGLTLECARCHDHKYDPISQRDYYELAAFFANIDESGLYSHFTNYVPTPVLDLPTAAQEAALHAAKGRVAEAELEYQRVLKERVSAALSTSESVDIASLLTTDLQASYTFGQTPATASTDSPLPPPDANNAVASGPAGSFSGGPTATWRNDTEIGLTLDGENGFNTPVGGDWDWYQPFTIGLWIKPSLHHERAVIWHRSRAWTDAASCGYELLLEDGKLSAALIHFWPGDAIRVQATEALPVGQWSHVTVTWDGSGHAHGLRLYVDGAPTESQIVRDKLHRTIRGGGAGALTIGNRFRDRGFKQGSVDDFKIFSRELSAVEVAAMMGSTDLDPTAITTARVTATDSAVKTQAQQLFEARRQLAAMRDAIPAIMTMKEEPGLHEVHVLRRGSYEARGELVEQPEVLNALGSLPEDAPKDRRGLAEWLVDSRPGHRNPLVARVAVNRLWGMFFDRPLVGTAEDLGMQGEPPTHPQLLDYLAATLIDEGWDLKRVTREIVMSDAYRRSSTRDARAREIDPDNRWLAAGPGGRLPVETLRDAALAAGGLLVRTHGGPPVYPYQPPGLWEEKSGQVYQRQAGAPSHRRSLYTIWKRTSPPPSMLIFDAPEREVCSAKRTVTRTPLQALVLLNDDQFVEAARGAAYQLLVDSDQDDRADANRLLQRLLGRPGTDVEIEAIVGLVERQQQTFEAQPQSAKDYLAIGDFNPFATDGGDQLDAAKLAAWAVAAQTIMNLHEWVTR